MNKNDLIELLVKLGYSRAGLYECSDLQLKKIGNREKITNVWEFQPMLSQRKIQVDVFENTFEKCLNDYWYNLSYTEKQRYLDEVLFYYNEPPY